MEIEEYEPPGRLWLYVTAGVVVVALVVAFFVWTLQTAGLKARLVEAVQRATGRTLTIAGDTRFKFSFSPSVSMDDVTLTNPPGFSRAEMVKVARVDMGLALLSLLQHRVEVDHVTLVRPDIVMERDAAGRANWVFARETAPPAANAAPAPAAPPVNPPAEAAAKQELAVWFRNVSVVDGHLGWIDGRSGRRHDVDVTQLSLDAPIGEPAKLTGALTFEGRTIALTGRAEPTEGPGASGTAPWPIGLKIESGDASLTVDGQMDQPLTWRGYTLAIDANLPDPSFLAPWFPRLPLTALKAVTGHAEVADSGAGPVPTISMAQLKIGSVDISGLGHDARLDDVTFAARGDSPIKLSARFTRDGLDSGINGVFGDLSWLAGGASGPVNVDMEWNAASARASLRGTIQAPARPAGFALDVAVNVPKPALVMNDAPPALRSVMFQTRLTDAPGPVPFQLTSNAGDLTGALTVSRLAQSPGPIVSVEGQIASQRLDLDMLLARPAGSGAPNAPKGPQPGPVGATAEKPPLIPNTDLRLELLRNVEGNVRLAFGDVRLDGVDIRKIDGVVAVKDGQLRVDPFTIAAPDQRMNGLLVADGARSPPVVHLAVNAPSVAVQPLLGALGLPQVASGNAGIQADLTGTGVSPRAIAASLNGFVGVALEGGQLDTKTINDWLGQVQPLHFSGPDVTDLRCFAMRGNAKAGVVTIGAMALNTPALIVEGGGDVDLGQETMALRLRPRAKIGGTGIAVPVRVSGPLREPSAKIDISGKGVGTTIGGLLLGGKDVMAGDPCPEALARARESAAAEPAPPPGGKP